MIRPLLAAALSAGLLAACAGTPTTYGPAGAGANAVGYDDLRIEDDRWRVTFIGGSDATAADAERLALRRAAELTLEAGYDWFEVAARRTEGERGRQSPVRVGGGVGQTFGSGGFRGTSTGLGISFSPGQESRAAVSLEIVARRGDRPDRPDAYDARSILSNVI